MSDAGPTGEPKTMKAVHADDRGRPIHDGRFDMTARKPIEEANLDV